MSGTARANDLVNGDFSGLAAVGSLCSSAKSGGASAALAWTQWALVPRSYLCTKESAQSMRSTSGPMVAPPPDAMGNGVGQSFPVKPCASASFSIQVQTGQVTGNLVRADGPFVSYPIFVPVANAGFKFYSQVAFQPVVGLWFETLSPAGLIGPFGVNYTIKDARVGPCLSPVPKDLTRSLSMNPIDFEKNPGRTRREDSHH